MLYHTSDPYKILNPLPKYAVKPLFQLLIFKGFNLISAIFNPKN